MELRIPSVEQLRTIYDRDLKEAFPTAELKPLRNIEKSWAEGWYKPYCLFDGDNIVGEAFLWLGHPGWALLDYLCVSSIRRNGGVGASILEKLREREADTVIFGESEAPEDAPDPEMARRRLGFYARCGLRTAGYDTEMFGVHYKTLYLAGGVAANSVIRADLERACEKAGCRLYLPPLRWCGDNGAMIGAQGYYEYLAGHTAGMDLNAYATRDISE